jgi:hypothetical protein
MPEYSSLPSPRPAKGPSSGTVARADPAWRAVFTLDEDARVVRVIALGAGVPFERVPSSVAAF